jgi:hypothetical protein
MQQGEVTARSNVQKLKTNGLQPLSFLPLYKQKLIEEKVGELVK